MQARVITLKYSEGAAGFPEDALRKATFGREVLDVREHFFVYGNVPHLTLVVMMGDAPGDAGFGGYRRDGQADRKDPEEDLSEELRGIYRALKQWRNDTARNEGRPAYAIARNVQLAELVKAAPKSLAAIREIEGFGGSFCDKYGETILKMLNTPGVESEH